MFSIGDVIVYGLQGVCKIDSMQTKQIGKLSADYFVLKPIFSENTSLFVPVENKNLTDRMQSLLTVDEAKDIIAWADRAEIIETKDENQKRDEYKGILASNDRHKLLSLIKTIHCEKNARRECGKSLHISDEQTLNKAENLLYNELGFVLKAEPSDIKNKIKF